MKIAEKLRKIREEKGYSQESMAYSIGVSYVTYHNIEKGKSDIKFSVLEKCAEILGIPLFDLLPECYTTKFQKKSDEFENQLDEKNKIISSLLDPSEIKEENE